MLCFKNIKKCSTSILPSNIRKPEVLECFRGRGEVGGIEVEHWLKRGYNIVFCSWWYSGNLQGKRNFNFALKNMNSSASTSDNWILQHQYHNDIYIDYLVSNQQIYIDEYIQATKHWFFHDRGLHCIETSLLI